MRKILTISTLALGLAATVPLFAGDRDPDCRDVAPEARMGIEAAIARANELGYKPTAIETDDGCYEIEARDRDGRKVEVYLHPASGEVLRVKEDD